MQLLTQTHTHTLYPTLTPNQILESLVRCAQDEDENVSETIHKCAENIGLYVEVQLTICIYGCMGACVYGYAHA